jgi:hypothetical protein
VPGQLVYEPNTRTGTFIPAVDLVPGELYFATVAQPRDLAGNVASPPGSWWIRPMRAASISLQSSSRIVTFGTPIVLSGVASIPKEDSPTLESRKTGAEDFTRLAVTLPAGGFFSTLVTPTITTTYRVTYPGSATSVAASSPNVTVAVRWWLVLSGRGPAVVRTGRQGRPVTVEARAAPLIPGSAVSFRLYRYDSTRGHYVYAGSRGTRTRLDGTARILWTPAGGRWQWRVAMAAVPGVSAATSHAYTWSIAR